METEMGVMQYPTEILVASRRWKRQEADSSREPPQRV